MQKLIVTATDGTIWEQAPVLNPDGVTYSLAWTAVGTGGTPAQFTGPDNTVWQPVTINNPDGTTDLAFTVAGSNGVPSAIAVCAIILDLIGLDLQPEEGVALTVTLKTPQAVSGYVVDPMVKTVSTDVNGHAEIDIPQGLKVEIFTIPGIVPFAVDTTGKPLIRVSDLISGGV